MITDCEIEQAKRQCALSGKAVHEHPDCICMAYQWLDVQTKTKHPNTRKTWAIKHLIEKWCGRYVSQADVEIAAYLHPGIIGRYPWFNISSVLTEPTIARLKGFGEAFRHEYRVFHQAKIYQRHEVAGRAPKNKKETDFREGR